MSTDCTHLYVCDCSIVYLRDQCASHTALHALLDLEPLDLDLVIGMSCADCEWRQPRRLRAHTIIIAC